MIHMTTCPKYPIGSNALWEVYTVSTLPVILFMYLSSHFEMHPPIPPDNMSEQFSRVPNYYNRFNGKRMLCFMKIDRMSQGSNIVFIMLI